MSPRPLNVGVIGGGKGAFIVHPQQRAIFFDGTWNEPPDHTNVRRLRLMLAEHGDDGIAAKCGDDGASRLE